MSFQEPRDSIQGAQGLRLLVVSREQAGARVPGQEVGQAIPLNGILSVSLLPQLNTQPPETAAGDQVLKHRSLGDKGEQSGQEEPCWPSVFLAGFRSAWVYGHWDSKEQIVH